jgi:hypothetical protein
VKIAISACMLLCCLASGAQAILVPGPTVPLELEPLEFEGSPSYMLSNGTIELTFLRQGASLASIVLSGWVHHL